ncbi:MAG: elongation factor G [Oscillospiraceae bacterium]|nr:elongation factor G [Oscillospiraceae bacterium]
MSYTARDIRNVCFMGHGGDGKTALAESMLYYTKVTDRLGKSAEGNTVSDFDPEEIRRKYSISTSIIPIEYGRTKINILDNPGYFDFAGEVMQSVRVVDAGVIVVSAKNGLGVGTEKSWKYLYERKLPKFVYISKLDEEHADFFKTFEQLREKFGKTLAPITIPIVEGDKTIGIVDIIHKNAFLSGKGKSQHIDIPADLVDTVDEYYEFLCEAVAETSEENMDKYFSGEPFDLSEIIAGVAQGVKDLSLVPVFCGSAMTGLGTAALINGIVDFAPNPTEGYAQPAVNENGEEVFINCNPGETPALFVFKTVSDQYGKQSYFKVISGDLKPDMALENARTGDTEKLGHLYTARGKKTYEVKELCCGDIGVVSKLTSVKTGDTLCIPGRPLTVHPVDYPEPCYSRAVYAKVKGQEEKIATGLARLAEEDLSFTLVNNAETKEMVLTGAGDIHLDVLCSKLKSKFGVDCELRDPKVAYRETIRGVARDIRGRHKKQSGGHGQFGDVVIDFMPGDTPELTFEEQVVGGAVPKNFFPAVEKGLRESCEKGVLAGYPMVYVKAILKDGSYHPVDSSEMAFKTAASLAFKDGIPKAKPVILEPIGTLNVTIPDAMMGDIMGDLSKRRGRVMGMTPNDDGDQVVEAEVPMGEMMSYAIDLRSMTQGRGSFTFKFVRYEEVPASSQAAIIEAAKADED